MKNRLAEKIELCDEQIKFNLNEIVFCEWKLLEAKKAIQQHIKDPKPDSAKVMEMKNAEITSLTNKINEHVRIIDLIEEIQATHQKDSEKQKN